MQPIRSPVSREKAFVDQPCLASTRACAQPLLTVRVQISQPRETGTVSLNIHCTATINHYTTIDFHPQPRAQSSFPINLSFFDQNYIRNHRRIATTPAKCQNVRLPWANIETLLTHSPVFCDYCDVYLTHDSMSVRKAHNSGRNHLRNVVDYYQRKSLCCLLCRRSWLTAPHRNRSRKGPVRHRLHHQLLRRRRPSPRQPHAATKSTRRIRLQPLPSSRRRLPRHATPRLPRCLPRCTRRSSVPTSVPWRPRWCQRPSISAAIPLPRCAKFSFPCRRGTSFPASTFPTWRSWCCFPASSWWRHATFPTTKRSGAPSRGFPSTGWYAIPTAGRAVPAFPSSRSGWVPGWW